MKKSLVTGGIITGIGLGIASLVYFTDIGNKTKEGMFKHVFKDQYERSIALDKDNQKFVKEKLEKEVEKFKREEIELIKKKPFNGNYIDEEDMRKILEYGGQKNSRDSMIYFISSLLLKDEGKLRESSSKNTSEKDIAAFKDFPEGMKYMLIRENGPKVMDGKFKFDFTIRSKTNIYDATIFNPKTGEREITEYHCIDARIRLKETQTGIIKEKDINGACFYEENFEKWVLDLEYSNNRSKEEYSNNMSKENGGSNQTN